MTRIALLSSEPVRERMAGIGLRYLELARRLPVAAGVETVLVSPADPEATRAALAAAEAADGGAEGVTGDAAGGAVEVRRFHRGGLARLLADCDGAVAQGQLANDLVLECPRLPTAIDLYDPWLVENLHYREELGLAPYENDHASWVLQMARGDFFLCSSEEQRGFYLGFLAALGRVNPDRLAGDPDLARLIAPVPFGVPQRLAPHRPWLPERRPGERRVLFGGLYDWYDPWTLLAALERLGDDGGGDAEAGGWRLLLIANPNPGSTPQRLLREVERECRRRGWWGSRVELLDWVPADRRWDLLRDVDCLAAPHRPSLETRLSLRTRFLDAAAAGCPAIVTEGGTASRLVAEHGAGWVVPPEDPEALAAALRTALGDPEAAARRRRGAAELAARFAWERVLAPLAGFCRSPRIDPTKERFAFRPPTVAPAEGLAERARRRIGRWRRRLAGGHRAEPRPAETEPGDPGRAERAR